MGNICCCGEKANSDDGIKQPFKDSQSSQELKGDYNQLTYPMVVNPVKNPTTNPVTNPMTITAVTNNSVLNINISTPKEDIYSNKRRLEYDTCANCDRYNTSKARCKSCDPNLQDEPSGDPDYQFEMELPHEIKNEGEEDEEPPEADKSKDDDNEPPEDIDDQFGMELRDDDINDDEPPV
ncbi:11232_t:CDS:2 [Entrophospora sp. SA101]|nr:11232_t:CDS:2 [Entrophospora sp. SA101]